MSPGESQSACLYTSQDTFYRPATVFKALHIKHRHIFLLFTFNYLMQNQYERRVDTFSTPVSKEQHCRRHNNSC